MRSATAKSDDFLHASQLHCAASGRRLLCWIKFGIRDSLQFPLDSFIFHSGYYPKISNIVQQISFSTSLRIMTENRDDPFVVLSASRAGRANRGRRLLRIPRSAVTAVSRTCPPCVNASQDTLASQGRARKSMPHRTSSLLGNWEVYRAREGKHQALQPTRAFIKCIPAD